MEEALARLLDQLKRSGSATGEWLSSHARPDAFRSSWASCNEPTVVLQLYARTGDRPRIVQAACGCARLGLIYLPSGEERPVRAIEAAEAWVHGAATIDQVRKAAEDAFRASGRTGLQDLRTMANEPAASSASFAALAACSRDAEIAAVHYARAALVEYGALAPQDASALLATFVRAYLPCPTLQALKLF